jgi:CheY-like chemotaxis protein
MKCPRCQSSISSAPDAEGFLKCPACGARLRSRSAPATVGALTGGAAKRTSPLAEGSPDEIRGVLTRLDPDADRFPDAVNPHSTLPPGTPLPRIPRPGSPEAAALFERSGPPPPSRGAGPEPARPDSARVMRAPGARDVPRQATEGAGGSVLPAAPTLEALMAEVHALRRMQEEMLALLRAGAAPSNGGRSIDVADELGLPAPTVVRARRRKTVLLVDDDAETSAAAQAALDAAEIPVRVVAEGRSALAAIAEDKPDVIVMELGLGGPMAGKDVVNMIKATMDWVDIPILLYTRIPVTSQKEARTVHGADEFVSKQDGPEPLLARVVTLFRRG